ncbi:MAG: outer membrane lipoprotein required for phospholipid trafficking MlaA [Oceanicaulis sp. HLUCCA04]|nr:MAG: outer membrane lipoprotein required for phospholipid trafficking MlaA [Oceanicaulis sp. HLUCCA04]
MIARALLVAASAFALSGCISLLPEADPNALYRLSNHVPAEAVANQDAPVVRIGRPIAPRALASDRVALDTGEGRLAYMAGVNWVSAVPVLFQELVIDTFDRRSGALVAARPDDGVATSWDLRLELRRFEAVYDQGDNAAPRIDVAVRARLIDAGNREVSSVRTFEVSQRADSNRQPRIIDAFSRASSDVSRELVDWASERVSQAEE